MDGTVFGKVMEILREQGLEGVLELNQDLSDSELWIFESPENSEGFYLTVALSYQPIEQGQTEKQIVTILDLLHEEEDDIELCVGMQVSEDGTLIQPLEIRSGISPEHYDLMKTEAGANFAPLFKKMVELYKKDYNP